jgi:hypothetical protein
MVAMSRLQLAMNKYALRQTKENGAMILSSEMWNRDAYRDLLGICEGMLADGEINSAEVNYLKRWIEKNHWNERTWPFPDLKARLDAVFASGAVTPEEYSELTGILKALIGKSTVFSDPRLPGRGMAGAPQVIFNDPPPIVEFSGREFCVTGVFAFGQRGTVEKAIEDRGGTTVKSPTTSTHYLVVGSFVATSWNQGNFGTKINRALSLRDNGAPIAIVGEEHWKKFLLQ